MDATTLITIFTFLAAIFAVLFIVFAIYSFQARKKAEATSTSNLPTSQTDPRLLGSQAAYVEEGSPFWPQHLAELFVRPRKFFTSQLALGRTPYFIFVTWCYGISSAIDQVFRDLGRAARAKAAGKTMEMVGGSWFEFWLWVLGIGAIGAVVLWWLGGWWFRIRLRWSGAKELQDSTAQLLYVYSSFVESAPTIALMLFWTATDLNIREAFTRGRSYLAVLLVFSVWSLVTSYIGARTLFDVKPWKARLWLLFAPLFFYIIPIGLLAAYLLSFRPQG
jgi:hypothetical protein